MFYYVMNKKIIKILYKDFLILLFQTSFISKKSESTNDVKKCSEMEITLKSSTLPRPRKSTKAEIILSNKSPINKNYYSKIMAKIDKLEPRRLIHQNSEMVLPISTVVSRMHRSNSVEPQTLFSSKSYEEKNRSILNKPLQKSALHGFKILQKPNNFQDQNLLSQRSNSFARNSTIDSDADSTLSSAINLESIHKSPREYIIPITVEGNFLSSRSGSIDLDCASNQISLSKLQCSKTGKTGSLLSDASDDESSFSTVHR